MTTAKVKPPTKAEILKTLVPLRIKQMEEENNANRKRKEDFQEKLNHALEEYVRSNFLKLSFSLEGVVRTYSSWVTITFEDGGTQELPDHIIKMREEFNKLPYELHSRNEMKPQNVLTKLRQEISQANPSALASSVKVDPVEKMPVVEEYLAEFLKALSRNTQAVERLVTA